MAYVLEGSVRKAGPLWRITAQLIDGRSDTHVWSDAFTREFEIAEIFDIQDEIHARLRILDPDNPGWPLHEAMVEPDLVKFDMAIALGRYLVDRDPLNGRLYFRLGQSYLYAGRYEEAIEA